MPHRKTYNAIDLAKFLCALLVLFYHYFSEHGPIPFIFEEALSLYAVAVALFMAISGFLIQERFSRLGEAETEWTVVRRQVFRILTIYLLWSIPYLLFQIARWDFTSISVAFIISTVRRWIFSSTFYTIWFMPSLAVGLLCFYAIKRFLGRKWLYVISAICFACGSLLSTYSFLGAKLPGYEGVSQFINNWLQGDRGGLLYALPFVTVGSIVSGIKEKIKLRWSLPGSIFGMLLLLGEGLVLRNLVGHTGIDLCFSMILAVFCILAFLISWNPEIGNCGAWMRKMSILIFMTQRIFLTVIPALLSVQSYKWFFASNYLGAIWICGGTILFSAGIILLSKRVYLFKYLY